MSVARELACRVCGQPGRYVFDNRVLAAHDVAYFGCARCGYLQTETPDWLDGACARAINLLARAADATGRQAGSLSNHARSAR